jgi:hypothetical protein
MDGTLADFSSAFPTSWERLFGPGPGMSPVSRRRKKRLRRRLAKEETAAEPSRENIPLLFVIVERIASRRADRSALAMQPKPTEEGAVKRIHSMMLRHRWEVFFITQRPGTDGDTVQRQTQHWLVEQGFDLPSVLVLGGSRGAAAGALRLNFIDDSPQNCLDVIADSRARPILIVPDNDESTLASARKVGIGTAPSIGACLDILETVTAARTRPGLLARLAAMVGWK